MAAIRIGVIAGAATAGVLLGFGLRHGTALQPLTGAGRIMLSSLAFHVPEAVLAIVGAILHLAITTLWAWCALQVVRRMAGRTALATTMVAAGAWVVSAWVLPSLLGAVTIDLSLGQQLVFFGVLDVTLWGGIRLAQMA